MPANRSASRRSAPARIQVRVRSTKSFAALGGQLVAIHGYLYAWNMLPIGQQLRERELASYEKVPPLQPAETYELSGILREMKAHKGDD